MSFESQFPDLYKGAYSEELVAAWRDIKEENEIQHPLHVDSFIRVSGGALRPTHHTVKVPPNTAVVYYPSPSEHTIFSPFRPGETALYLGEIENMRNHGVFVDREGKIQYGIHIWLFRVIPSEEL